MVIVHNNEKFHIAIISLVYFLAHGLGLLNTGIFWDDWIWYKTSHQIMIDSLTQLGSPWIGVYLNYVFEFPNSILVFRLITFFSFYLSALFLYSILKSIKEISLYDRLLITMFFVVFPSNLFRISVCLSWYAISYCLFFCAFWLLKQYMFKGKIYYRLLSLFIFFCSFTTNSLLVFFVLAFIYIFYCKKIKFTNEKVFAKIVLNYSDFILLPIMFWICKKVFFPSYGLYQSYNSISYLKILLSPFTAIASFYESFFAILDKIIFYWPFPSIMVLLMAWFYYMLKDMRLNTTPSVQLHYSYFGLFCFFIAVFPYLAVGHIPAFDGVDSRHQLLIPLGISILIVYIVQYSVNKIDFISSKHKTLRIIYGFLVVQFLAFDINSYMLMQADWYKQEAIISQIKNNNVIKEHTTFLFHDDMSAMNAGGRRYRFYEYAAFMKQAFGEEKRFGIDYNVFYADKRKKSGDGFPQHLNENNLLGSYQRKEPEFIVHIEKGNMDVSTKQIFTLLKDEMLNKEKFREDVRELISLRIEKM